MNRTARIAAIAVTFPLVLSTMIALRRAHVARESEHPSKLVDAPGTRFQIVEENGKAYKWSSITNVISDGAGKVPPIETVFEGKLNVRLIRRGGAPKLAVQLSPLHVRIMGEANANMERTFSTPFVVAIDERGKLGDALFTSYLTPGDRAVLDSCIRSLQVIFPQERAQRWETTESDTNGQFLAAYEQEDPLGVLEKRKVRYLQVRQQGIFSIHVLASSIRAEVDPAGPWLRVSAGLERLRLEGPGGHALASVESRFTLEAAREPPDAKLGLWRDDLLETAQTPLDAAGSASRAAWDEAAREKERRRLAEAGVTLDGLVAGLRAHRPNDATFAHDFASFLQVFPDDAKHLPAKLDAMNDSAASLLLNVLELAGTPEAASALADILENPKTSRANRIRSLAAMAGLVDPGEDTLARLRHVHDSTKGKADSNELSSAVRLTLGALANHARPDLRLRIIRELEIDLRKTTDHYDERQLLLALDNAHASLPSSDLQRYLGSESASVREAAASLAANSAKSGDKGATESLLGLLVQEKAAAVRSAAIGGLQQLPHNAEINLAVRQALSGEQEAGLRAEMVRYLATQMKAFPENRRTLGAELKRETDRGVMVAILNALGR